ncbi:MAG: PEP-CTERM sorting domain-containing protein [Gammaproteobacteria bacterium]|nr:PEP-CTERM sorting domain-containing protein [Gammaproteobacteria bacterium]
MKDQCWKHGKKLRRLSVCIAAVGVFGALPAAANIIDSLSAEAFAAAGSTQDSVGPVTGSPSVTASASAFDGGDSGSGFAFGNNSGVFGVFANAFGSAEGEGRFSRSWEITNDAAFAQNYTFDFFIYGGSMGADTDVVGASSLARYLLDIVFNGVELFTSHAQINSAGELTTSGTALDGAFHSGNFYSWQNTYLSFDLGTLAAGDSWTLQYDLVGYAFGDYGPGGRPADCDFDGYGYGGGIIAFGGGGLEGSACNVQASVGIGDPFNIGVDGFEPATFRATPASAVPEPGALGLLGLSLAAMFGFRRRLRRT